MLKKDLSLHLAAMATPNLKLAFIWSFCLIYLNGIHCQSYGTIPTTLARIESQLGDVHDVTTHTSNTTDHLASRLDNYNQQLQTLSDHGTVQDQLMATMVDLLQKQDQQMTAQNEILSTMADLLQKQDEKLEKQDKQLQNMVAGISSLSKQLLVQNQFLDTVASSLQNMTERSVNVYRMQTWHEYI